MIPTIHLPENFRGLAKWDDVALDGRRNLPHWRIDGGTYFVTFRLADALPASKGNELRELREWWKNRIDSDSSGDEKLKQQSDEFHQKYGRLLERFLDAGYGECILGNHDSAQIVRDSLMFFHGKRYEVSAFVVMPNHCHVVVTPFEGFDLGSIIHSWKSYSAKEINRISGGDGQVWQHEYFDRIIRDAEHFNRVVNYVWQNAAKAGLDVDRVLRYP